MTAPPDDYVMLNVTIGDRATDRGNKALGMATNATDIMSHTAAPTLASTAITSAALSNFSEASSYRNGTTHDPLLTQPYGDTLASNSCTVATEEFYYSYFDVQLAVPEWEAILTTLVLSVIIILTIIGNILVILSVFTYKPLRIVQNFFIVSLAVADLTVALLVLPFNVAYSLFGRWEFGIHMCKMWLTCDVMCCTSSILNLCAIALDRYWAITDPINYAQKRTVGRVLLLIGGVWIVSLVISSPPLVGWNDWPEEFTSATPCELTTNRGYVIYSSLGSFFIPLAIMTIVYVEIYIATRRRLRERALASKINTIAMKASRPCKDLEAAAEVSGSALTDAGGGGSVVGGSSGAGLAALGKERFFSYFGLHTCCNKGSEETTTTSIIQTDQDSMCSDTNVQYEGTQQAVEHRVVVVSQRHKSRRTKIKDSIKHGKGRAVKNEEADGQVTPSGPHKYSGGGRGGAAEQLLLPPTVNVERDRDSIEISTGSGSDQKSRALDGDIQEMRSASADRGASAGGCTTWSSVDGIDEQTSLKITPSQSTVEATSTQAKLPIAPKKSMYQFIEEKQKISLSKERRAARTLGIIMGVFVICWLPFFLMYVILPFCETCCPTNKFKNFITWLGYINSGLNPIIYTIFNLDYRRAFKILLGIK